MVKEVCMVNHEHNLCCGNCPMTLGKCIKEKDISNDPVTKAELKEQIIKIAKMVYEKNKYLYEIEVHEQCIAAYFWHYFVNEYSEKCYSNYDIDIEYNRIGDDVKKTVNSPDDEEKQIRPDMIIHKRGCSGNNFAMVEFKTSWNKTESNKNDDYSKLEKTTNNKGNLKYKYGISFIFCKNINDSCITFFVNGKKCDD